MMKKSLRNFSSDEIVEGVLASDRAILGRAITLVESKNSEHQKKASTVLSMLPLIKGETIRIGITGVPGVGKSTFIETLGVSLLEKGHKVAVLAVDPSSNRTGGSVLGDKTRMERLSKDDRCFIRPTPTSGTLGGVAQRTLEVITICEAAGYDVILIETVGVGQSEVAVRDLVDHFLLLMLPGAGDSLQGIKRGIIELADQIAINKSDGINVTSADLAKREYENALHHIPPITKGWSVPVVTCSSVENSGIDDIWKNIVLFSDHIKKEGIFEFVRKGQASAQFNHRVDSQILEYFKSQFESDINNQKEKFLNGQISLEDSVNCILKKIK